jgi:glycosyltransferase involved in cell wall biosynthesis
LGQLHSGQYIDIFIDAARHFVNNDTCFIIVGGGYDLDRCIAKAQDLVDRGKINFTGFVERSEVRKYLAATNVAVACFEDNDLTRSKSPLKIAEYMAAGKAIVASEVGEVERMLNGSGVLVKPGDSVAIAEGIQKLLLDKNL